MKIKLYSAFCTLLILGACNYTTSPETEKPKKETVIGPAIDTENNTLSSEKYNVILNLEKGKTYLQKCLSKATIYQTISLQQATMSIEASCNTSFKVLDVQNDVYDMEVRYEKLSLTIGVQQIERLYTTESHEQDVMTNTMLGLKNKPFSLKMTRAGKITEVKGFENLLENIIRKQKGLDEASLKKLKVQMMQAFGENTLKGNIELCSAVFPTAPVSVGERWTVNGELRTTMVSKVEHNYELKDVNDQYYQLAGNSKITTQDNDVYAEMNGVQTTYDMTGTMTSEITIDRKSGWIKKASFDQSIKGTAKIKGAVQMVEETTVPMSLLSKTTITD